MENERFSLTNESGGARYTGATVESPTEVIAHRGKFIAKTREQFNELVRAGGWVPTMLPERVPCIGQISATLQASGSKRHHADDMYVMLSCRRLVLPATEDVGRRKCGTSENSILNLSHI
jgi:hypothetical protein